MARRAVLVIIYCLNRSKIYILGFFRAYMGREDFKYLFTNDRKPPAGVDTPVIASYTESPESILVIDDFSNRQSPDVNTAGGADTTTNLTIKTCSNQTCNTPPPAAWLQDPA